MRKLILLTGPMRSGKTSFCKALFKLLKEKSPLPFAIVEENERDREGIPISLALRDLGTEEEIPLASREWSLPPVHGAYPPFVFSAQAFSWAEARVRKSVEMGCGPVLLDEIGPLEANKGEGLFGIIEWTLINGSAPLLLTIRPDLVESFTGKISASTGFDSVERYRIDALPLGQGLQTVLDVVFHHCQKGK
jgi:nucleoside-triphosphatase THEP1